MKYIDPIEREHENMTPADEEKIDSAATEILDRFREAFEELAK